MTNRLPIQRSKTPVANLASPRFQCDQCAVKCERESDLQRHEATKHGMTDVVFVCTSCSFENCRKDKAGQHQRDPGHVCVQQSALLSHESLTRNDVVVINVSVQLQRKPKHGMSQRVEFIAGQIDVAFQNDSTAWILSNLYFGLSSALTFLFIIGVRVD